MGQTLNVTMKRFNGTDNDDLLLTPALHASTHEAGGSDPITVQTENIADGAITKDKMSANAVGTANIEDEAVTADKIADGVLPTAKLNSVTINGFTIYMSTTDPDDSVGKNGDIWIRYNVG